MKYLFYLLLCIVMVSIISCWGVYDQPYHTLPKQWAWKAVYGADTSYRRIAFMADTPVVNAGKIYVKDNYIYQCETGAGIHVIDNTNPADAKRTGFISIPGCEEISISGSVLYTNNYYDLVGVDISNLTAPHILSRVRNAFHTNTQYGYHSWEEPDSAGYYQCPAWYADSIILGWVMDSVYANCYK